MNISTIIAAVLSLATGGALLMPCGSCDSAGKLTTAAAVPTAAPVATSVESCSVDKADSCCPGMKDEATPTVVVELKAQLEKTSATDCPPCKACPGDEKPGAKIVAQND